MRTDQLRMIVWLLVGIALYAVSIAAGTDNPATQTVFYKLGHVTTLAWFGYWISRNALGRVTSQSHPQERIARALIVAGVIIAGSMGL